MNGINLDTQASSVGHSISGHGNGDAQVNTGSKSHLFVFTNNKAGMDGLDKEHINKVIYEMSKGSKYLEHAEKQDSRVDKKLEEIKIKLKSLNEVTIKTLERKIEKASAEILESERLNRVCVVCDMDQFFAAVEMRDNPKLKNVPMAVGDEGMISTANYVARRFGVRSAMPGFIGKQLCPQLVLVPPDFGKYTAAAVQIREIFAEFDPFFRRYSLDEAYLDFTPIAKKRLYEKYSKSIGQSHKPLESMFSEKEIFDEACVAVEEMRIKILEKTHLSASAGLAPNFMLAKICADQKKPNGQFCLFPNKDEILEFLMDLPVRKIGGIGKVMEKTLSMLDIRTCGDLKNKIVQAWHVFTAKTSKWLLRVSLGVGSEELTEASVPDGAITRKGISRERTFSGIHSLEELDSKLKDIASKLAKDMSKHDLQGRVVTLKLKTVGFDVLTRAHTSATWVYTENHIYDIASKLLKAELPVHIRLMGIRVSRFRDQIDDLPPSNQLLLDKFIKKSAGPKDDQSHPKSFFARQISPDHVSHSDVGKNEQSHLNLNFPDSALQDQLSLVKSVQKSSMCKVDQNRIKSSLANQSCPNQLSLDDFLKKSSSSEACAKSYMLSSHNDGKIEQQLHQNNISFQNEALSSRIDNKVQTVKRTISKSHCNCPVCGDELMMTNDELNAHIDACLNSLEMKNSTKKRRKIDDFF